MPLLDGQVHHDTHAVPKGNYVIAVGISLIVSPSEVGNCVIADRAVRPTVDLVGRSIQNIQFSTPYWC